MQGFAANDATLSVGTGAFTGVKLHKDTTIDANSLSIPAGCYLSHVDLKFTAATSATSVDCYLTWDSAGDDPLCGLSETVKLTTGATTSSVKHTTIAVAEYARAPATQTTAGAVYIWLKSTGGTATLSLARLHWHDRA